MAVIRRDKKSSTQDLISAIEKFCSFLIKQKEDEASAQLLDCAGELSSTSSTDEVRNIAKKILQIFADSFHPVLILNHQQMLFATTNHLFVKENFRNYLLILHWFD